MADVVPSYHTTDMVGSQFFPLYLYDAPDDPKLDNDDSQTDLFAAPKRAPAGTARRDGITDAGLAHFASAYPGEAISKEDVFYYVYGILHSPDYRERYADNLGKELPRIPRMRTAKDFWAFSKAGRALGELHVNYEKVPEHPAKVEGPSRPTAAQHRVTKMRFGKGKDKTVVHYNDFITVREIPLEAYDYVVNGKSAIDWVMERQSVTTDKASGIVKDANDWATETVGDPRYPLSLLLRVVTVSLETMRIVRALPALDILEESEASKAQVGTATETEAKAAAELGAWSRRQSGDWRSQALNPELGPESESESALEPLPFRRVSPKAAERYKTCVPLIALAAAAGGWSDSQEGIAEPGSPHVEWASFEASHKLTKGMFVAQVLGRSMEPLIPDGAYCLFRVVARPSSPDRPVLVRHGGDADPETGGHYAVKFYREEKTAKGAKTERRIVLAPQNPEFPALVIPPREADRVRVIAEVVEVLRG